jgi:hypothetical protein
MNESLAKITRVEFFDGFDEQTFLLLNSQVAQLTDRIYGIALNQALIAELSARCPFAITEMHAVAE